MRPRTPRRVKGGSAIAVAAAAVLASAVACNQLGVAAAAPRHAGTQRTTWLVFDRGRSGRPAVPGAVPRGSSPYVYVEGDGVRAVPRTMIAADLFTSFSAFRRALLARKIPKKVRYVAYDPERWRQTPLSEQLRPSRDMLRFTALAREHGLRTILVPGRDLMLVHGARCRKRRGTTLDQAFVRCDVAKGTSQAALFVIQSAPEETSARTFLSLLRQVSAQVRRASPATTVVATLTPGTVPVGRLIRLARRSMRYVGGFEVNTSPSTMRTAIELMRRVGG